LVEVFGLQGKRNAKQYLHDLYKDSYLEDVLEGHVRPLTMPSYLMSPNVEYNFGAAGFREPTLKTVLDHFYYSAPQRLGCSKEVCVKALEKFEMIGIVPKSPEDVRTIILSYPSEQRSLNARCWVCLYKSYREVFNQLNGRYPAADIDFDFVEKIVGGTKDGEMGSKTEAEVDQFLLFDTPTREAARKAQAATNAKYQLPYVLEESNEIRRLQ
jgi:hypothetical protein